MIRRILSKNAFVLLPSSTNLLSILKKRIISISYYHSDSIDGNLPDEIPFEEQRLSSQEATGILRTHEASIDLEANCPVKYYEVNYLGANNPPGRCQLIYFCLFVHNRNDDVCFSLTYLYRSVLEDRQAQGRIRSPDSNMYLFGVFDGHGGPWCSDVVGQRLFEYIAVTLHPPNDLQRIMQEAKLITSSQTSHDKASLNTITSLLLHSYYNPYKDTRNSKIKEIHQMNLLKHIEDAYTTFDSDNTDIVGALESAFVKLDRDICAEAIPIGTQQVDEDLLQICTAGSCACVALVKDTDLYIANCGDARAILGK
jgi:serine/threonine protein phosphatase PrpC